MQLPSSKVVLPILFMSGVVGGKMQWLTGNTFAEPKSQDRQAFGIWASKYSANVLLPAHSTFSYYEQHCGLPESFPVFLAPLQLQVRIAVAGMKWQLHVLCQQSTRSTFLPSCTQDKSDERIQETLLVGYECYKGLYNMYITESYIKLCNGKCKV